MSIGYACLTVGVPDTGMKRCLLRNAGDEKLAALIRHNLKALENIIDYNDAHDISLFRIILISSRSVPVRSTGLCGVMCFGMS